MLRSHSRAIHLPLHALVEDPAWQAFKDTCYKVLAQVHAGRTGDEQASATQPIGAALARLSAPAGVEGQLTGALYDKAHDLGRLVCAKHVLGDNLDAAIRSFSTFLEASDLGRVEATPGFHRTASLRLHPGGAGAACDPHVLTTWAAGALHGLLEEAFNCRVSVTAVGPRELSVRLLEGRDVNREAQRL